MQTELRERLRELARTPLLLVAADYDGTLAEITAERGGAKPDPAAITALRALAETPWTRTAVVSGRSFKELADLLSPWGHGMLIGSHGAEWMRPEVTLTTDQRTRLEHLAGVFASIAADRPRLACERKPAGIAVYFAPAASGVAEEAVAAALERCGGSTGVRVWRGVGTIELMVVDTCKSESLTRAKRATGATATLFVEGENTDEDAFSWSPCEDVMIRVGSGETKARHRIGGIADVAAVL